MLAQMSHLLTPKQKRDLATAYLMQDMNFRVTQKQVGNGIGTILAKKKGQKGQGLLLGKNSPFKNIPLVGVIL